MPRIRYIFLVVFVGVTVAAPTYSGTLYKCKSPDGRIRYSDTGCPATSDVLKKKKGAPERPATPPIEGSAIPLAAAKFSQALVSLAPVRMAISQFYADQGEWPKKMGDIGFKESEMNSRFVRAVSIVEKGGIKAELIREFGNYKIIYLSPKLVMGDTSVEWECQSNVDEKILTVHSQSICSYKKR